MNSYFPELFKEGLIGKVRIPNRIVLAPLATGSAHINGEVSQEIIDYYVDRARGGVGLIIVESSCVSIGGRQGLGQILISEPSHVFGLTRLCEAIKANGSRAFIQLFHVGRETTDEICGNNQPVAPSAIACPIIKRVPHALTNYEIKEIVKQFIQSAHYAYKAGFDGVELHAAHGYLINEFLSPNTNSRTDEYGGSLENRQRFLLEIVDGIKAALPDLAICVRLNIDDFVAGGFEPVESLKVCKALEKAGTDIIHCAVGTYESGLTSIEPASYPEGWRVYLAEMVKKVVKIPVITGGMIRNPEFAEQVLANGQADFIFMARTLLADPQWPVKARQNRIQDIRPCISCNTCMGREFIGLSARCAVNPFALRERILGDNKQVKSGVKAIVAGGGPAGMQAALSLKRHGAEVTLYDRQSSLGGFMSLAGVPAHKDKILELRDYMIRQLESSRIDIKLNQAIDLPLLKEINPDILVVATGSTPVHPPIPGSNMSDSVEAVDILSGVYQAADKEVVVIGGGSTGCEVAEYMLMKKNRVTVVEMRPVLAAEMEKKNRRSLMDRLKDLGLKSKTSATVTEIKPGEVLIRKDDQIQNLPCDLIVWAVGFRSNDALYKQAMEIMEHVYIVGDASKVRGFIDGIFEGESVGNIVSALPDFAE